MWDPSELELEFECTRGLANFRTTTFTLLISCIGDRLVGLGMATATVVGVGGRTGAWRACCCSTSSGSFNSWTTGPQACYCCWWVDKIHG